MIKDELLLGTSNFLLKKTCLGCKKIGHRIEVCPILHYIPHRERIVHAYANESCQTRVLVKRKNNKIKTLQQLEQLKKKVAIMRNLERSFEMSDNDIIADGEDDDEKGLMFDLNSKKRTINSIHSFSQTAPKSVSETIKKLEKYETIENFECIHRFKNYYSQNNFSSKIYQELLEKKFKISNSIMIQSLEGPKEIKNKKNNNKKILTQQRKYITSRLTLTNKIDFSDLVKLIMKEPKLKKQLAKI